MKNEEKGSQETDCSRLRPDRKERKSMPKGNTRLESSAQNTFAKTAMSRRSFLQGTGAGAAGLAAAGLSFPVARATAGDKEEVALSIGITVPATQETKNMAEIAHRVEALGFESLWIGEHPVIPVAFNGLLPGGDKLPQRYYAGLIPLLPSRWRPLPPSASNWRRAFACSRNVTR
jgi:hypothetical protein